MSDLLLNVVVYIVSFIVIWAGAGLIVSSVNKLSHKLHIPAFFISFVVLGILTSTPEIAVGLSAVSSNTPSIFVGNLLGGIPVIFLFIVPLLAIFGRGIKLSHDLGKGSVLLSLGASIAPFLTVLDGQVSNEEGIALIAIYLTVVFLLQSENHFLNKKNTKLLKIKSYTFMDILKVLIGAGVLLFSSNLIVSRTIYFSEVFGIPTFYISLVLLSIGTNLPELTVALKAIITGRKDIAFGDYLGSASANAFLFGVFTLMSKDAVLQVNNFVVMFIIVAIGLALFYHFSKTKRAISPKEGVALLLVYLVFVAVELLPKMSKSST